MRYQISIGSNTAAEINLQKAHHALDTFFPDIRYSTVRKTQPLGLHNPSVFLDQVAQFSSSLPASQIIRILKGIEEEVGRMPGEKEREIIKIDLDLLASDKEVFKAEDLKRTYIQEGLAELNKKTMRFLGLIPARYASTRFPAKPLAMLGGKTVIQRVYEKVVGCVDDAYVATDDERIAVAVEAFGGKVVMTSTSHKSGTDRCREAATKVNGQFDVVINIQGDEPFIHPSQIETVKQCFDDDSTQIATLVRPFPSDSSLEQLQNPNGVKVVIDKDFHALYFSRSVIPYLRGVEPSEWLKHHTFYKHIGLYAYQRTVLDEITALPQSSLELAESLEQLRWLENGYTIKVGFTEEETIGIDTPEDLRRAEEFLKNHVE
ncbi:MAG: 3-deoxy-manno-octulosonate cytidylyltransferase [Bacteroidaceae bacterium]|nr:3-deoxy-manno-octulosonate cytidylyltransferase [Bacteroidaceae bacterium]